VTTEPAHAATGTVTDDPVVLDVRGVTVRFGGVVAVNDVSLQAPAGSITGLIGPNGAGKTTLFNVVTGLQSASAGQVLLGGEDITRLGPTRRARRGVGRTFQRLEVFGSMSAYDNVLTAAEFRRGWSDDHFDPKEETEQILERIGLAEVAGRRADTLSTGLARMLELGRALAAHPRLLLLDEPGSGLDDYECEHLVALLGSLTDDGMAILLVEHDMDLVMANCTTVHVLDQGSHIASGTAEEIQANPAVQAAYLGA
jgi:branched-chain amino acid transport system ATP-binding protein